MKNHQRKASVCAIMIIGLFALASCKPEVTTVGSVTLSVNPSAIEFAADDPSEKRVTVTTNAKAWEAQPSDEWIKVTKGESEFTVKADVYTATDKNRTGTITVSTGGAEKKIVSVTQAASVPPVVYVTGTDNACNALLWRDGVMEQLPIEYPDAVPASLFVSDGNVYAAGYEVELQTYTDDLGIVHETYIPYMVIWKNRIREQVGTAGTNGNAIFVSGNDVYVAGRQIDAEKRMDIPVLWKNGVAQMLPADKSTQARSVFVSGNDVYVVGHEQNGAAFLWKNGVVQKLSEKPSYAEDVYVYGNDVYVVGSKNFCSTVWKNGLSTQLCEEESVAASIFVSGEDVYVAGWEYDANAGGVEKARLWKNNETIHLSENRSSARDVYILGKDVYIAGVDYETPTQTGFRAVIWKNGIMSKLHNDVSLTYSIFVK